MKAQVYWIEGPWPGRLAIVPRPRGGDWLEDEIQAWQHAGLDRVVSLLTPDEVIDLDLSEEEPWCQAHDIQFMSFPIPDRSAPASLNAALGLVHQLAHALATGQRIAVHCRQGIGRSALLAAGQPERFSRINIDTTIIQYFEAVMAVDHRPVRSDFQRTGLAWLQRIDEFLG